MKKDQKLLTRSLFCDILKYSIDQSKLVQPIKRRIDRHRDTYLGLLVQKGWGKEIKMEKRIATVGILVKNPKDIFQITPILSEFMDVIVGQMNIPYQTKDVMTITLIIDGTTDQIGALTGKLGQIESIKVKSVITE